MNAQIIKRFPGIGCAWVDAAGKEGAEYFGFADKEKQLRVDENTIFPACSISKFITAICIMKLHEQKLIDIDKSVNNYLQQWKLRTPDGTESTATIRAILCHTAGILDGEDAFYGLRLGDPEITLIDILDGKTSYNNRPTRSEKNPGTAFEYSDAGYCVLQLLIQDACKKPFEDFAQETIFAPLQLKSTFFVSSKNAERFESKMATGYDDEGKHIPGRFPVIPDLAASGLWTTPKELLVIAKAFVAVLNRKATNGGTQLLQPELAQEMAKPVKDFSWTGLGVFIGGEDILVSQGWGENGQCMLKMNLRTKEISIVMTNQNPGVDQTESGVEWLVNQNGLSSLIDLLQTHYGLKNVTLNFLREGGSKTYIVDSADDVNANANISAASKKYFLKVISPAFSDTAKQSVMIMRYLEENNFPVPQTNLTKNGEAILEAVLDDEKHLVVLQEFLDGDEPNLEETAEEVGELVGSFHQLMETCPVKPVSRNKHFFIGRYLDYLRKKTYPKLSVYEELAERLWKQVEKLPVGNCHGDLHRGNLLQTKSGKLYLLDFDTVCQAPVMFDIMVMCDMTDYFNLKDEDIAVTKTVYKKFLSGYSKYRRLSPEEEASFFAWVAIRHFQLQATILDINGIDCIDERFIDWQLCWLEKWIDINKI